MNLTVPQEKKLHDEVMGKYKKMKDAKLKKIIKILDHTEGLCMPEFLEFCKHLQSLEK